MKVSGGKTYLPVKLNHPPDSDLQDKPTSRKPHHRRRTRNPGFSGPGIRLRREGPFSSKRSGPATPLLRWKFDADVPVSHASKGNESGRKSVRKVRNAEELSVSVSISARKLAAGLWQLQKPKVFGSGVVERNSSELVGFKSGGEHVGDHFHCRHSGGEFSGEVDDLLQNPHLVPAPKNGMLYKVEPSLPFHNPAMEGATKWDPVCSKTSDEVYRFYGHMKLLEDQQVSNASVVASLQSELEQARARIDDLETERRSSKKKLEHFLSKLAEEKAAWWSREHEKIRAIIDDVKDDQASILLLKET